MPEGVGIRVVDCINFNGCVVSDEGGVPMARLEERGGMIVVHRLGRCPESVYRYIIFYLRELGIDTE